MASFLKRALCALALTAAGAVAAEAQTCPSDVTRLLVGFPPGGSTDIFARLIADELTKMSGKAVIVENRGGANAIIATEMLAKSKPDGCTLMMTISSHITNGALYNALPYNPLKDFAPVVLVARAPFVLLAHPSLPANDVQELVRLAKTKEINFGTPGAGSTQHLAHELMNSMAGVKMTHVAYKGGTPALNDLVAGHIDLAFLTTVQAVPFIRNRQVKGLAVSSTNRSPVVPEIPTVAESGIAGYEADVWFGVIAPAGTPEPVIGKLNADINRILQSPHVKERFAALDGEIVGGSAERFGALMRDEDAKWSKLIREIGLKLEQ